MHLSDEKEKQLRELLVVFLEENEKLNLSSHRTEEVCWEGNILDSLALLDVPSSGRSLEAATILDVGTGGGFPLLPLAICLPKARLVGLESVKKKIDAAERIAAKMSLRNVSFLCNRAETLGHDPQHREQYGLVLARAVAEISVLLEFCSPFAKVRGRIVLWKSMHVIGELREAASAAEKLRCRFVRAYPYTLKTRGERQLLIYEKTGPIPDEFSRRVGLPTKKPLQ